MSFQWYRGLSAPWSAHYDNEAGPGWDWFVSIPGGEPIMGLSQALAGRIVADHNILIAARRTVTVTVKDHAAVIIGTMIILFLIYLLIQGYPACSA
jgi:hypothetical protein